MHEIDLFNQRLFYIKKNTHCLTATPLLHLQSYNFFSQQQTHIFIDSPQT